MSIDTLTQVHKPIRTWIQYMGEEAPAIVDIDTHLDHEGTVWYKASWPAKSRDTRDDIIRKLVKSLCEGEFDDTPDLSKIRFDKSGFCTQVSDYFISAYDMRDGEAHTFQIVDDSRDAGEPSDHVRHAFAAPSVGVLLHFLAYCTDQTPEINWTSHNKGRLLKGDVEDVEVEGHLDILWSHHLDRRDAALRRKEYGISECPYCGNMTVVCDYLPVPVRGEEEADYNPGMGTCAVCGHHDEMGFAATETAYPPLDEVPRYDIVVSLDWDGGSTMTHRTDLVWFTDYDLFTPAMKEDIRSLEDIPEILTEMRLGVYRRRSYKHKRIPHPDGGMILCVIGDQELDLGNLMSVTLDMDRWPHPAEVEERILEESGWGIRDLLDQVIKSCSDQVSTFVSKLVTKGVGIHYKVLKQMGAGHLPLTVTSRQTHRASKVLDYAKASFQEEHTLRLAVYLGEAEDEDQREITRMEVVPNKGEKIPPEMRLVYDARRSVGLAYTKGITGPVYAEDLPYMAALFYQEIREQVASLLSGGVWYHHPHLLTRTTTLHVWWFSCPLPTLQSKTNLPEDRPTPDVTMDLPWSSGLYPEPSFRFSRSSDEAGESGSLSTGT